MSGGKTIVLFGRRRIQTPASIIKHKLSEEFLAALCADFETNGKDVIEKVRADKPVDYLRIVASLVPKELNLNSPGLEDMGDDEIL